MAGPAKAGLFLYAKDLQRLTHFYQTLLSMQLLHQTAELAVLQSESLQLVVHAWPQHIAAGIQISEPPEPRQHSALKFFASVPSLTVTREQAASLGGAVWEEVCHGPGFQVCNANDPEGNIFQVREFAE